MAALPDPVRTARLVLTVPVEADVPELFAMYADPRVWAADPVTRHRDADATRRTVGSWRAAWAADGLGMWVARWPAVPHPLVGIGGCFLRLGVAWNLGFRLVPDHWSRGYAAEISAVALAAARAARPELPVTAYTVEGNHRSRRTLLALGLEPVWRGPDAGNPDPTVERLLFSDRPLDDDRTRVLTAQ